MKIGGDDKSAILHFVAVKTPLKRRTLARSDRASVTTAQRVGGHVWGTNATPLAQDRRRLCCLSKYSKRSISKALTRLSLRGDRQTSRPSCSIRWVAVTPDMRG